MLPISNSCRHVPVSIDTVISVSPSSSFSRETGNLFNSLMLLLFSMFSEKKHQQQRLFKISPVLLKNELDGDTHVTVSIGVLLNLN